MKKILNWVLTLEPMVHAMAFCGLCVLPARAQEPAKQWYDNIKFSGYGMLQYQGQDKEGEKSNTFNLRILRLILDGKAGDFDWRVQLQGTSNTGPGQPTVQLVDLYAEWTKYKEMRVKVGQFHRAFTFENPTHPIYQGWYSCADVTNALAGIGDRSGEKWSAGRDIGVQVEGDLLPNASGRRLLHYQAGVYNGEGINSKDKDNRKDIMGGLWVMPVDGVRIGAFGWTGSRGGMTDGHGDIVSMGLQLNLEYARVNDRTIDNPDKHNYNLINAQLNIRF